MCDCVTWHRSIVSGSNRIYISVPIEGAADQGLLTTIVRNNESPSGTGKPYVTATSQPTRTIFAVLLGSLVLLLLGRSAGAQRYEVQLRDGQVVRGDRLSLASDRNVPTLERKPLLDEKNPARVLRDTMPASPLTTAFADGEGRAAKVIEMAGGDRLIGNLHEVVPGDNGAPSPGHLVVTASGHNGKVRVRLDWVRRIFPRRQDAVRVESGQLRRSDGRVLAGRSLRWYPGGLRVLTNDGIQDVPIGDIAELHLPDGAPQLPLPGAAFVAGEGPTVVRTVTADGQVFTFPRGMLEEYSPGRVVRRKQNYTALTALATRPPWSLDTVVLAAEEVAWQIYLNADEAPLSLLPVVEEQQHSAVHHLRWLRNRNVHGSPLQIGDASCELGVGMHSHSRVTFALPAGSNAFTTRVGLDRRAGTGGCVHCRIYRDEETSPLWERKFLRGSDGAQEVGPLNIEGAQHLTLEVDFADEGRPQGSDPLDVRDWVNWMMPTVRVDPSKLRQQQYLWDLAPEIAGWSVTDELLAELTLSPHYYEKTNTWCMALSADQQPLVLSRDMHVNLTNAWLPIAAAAADMPGSLHTIGVIANVEEIGPTMNGRIKTQDKGRFNDRIHILHRVADQNAQLQLVVESADSARRGMKGVSFLPLQLQPLIVNLPADGQPIVPDVPLTSLQPISAQCHGQPITLRRGMVDERVKLNVRGWHFDEGFGVPTGSEVTYKLDPGWKKFVAVIGLANGWKGAGPYQVFVDDELIWTSDDDFTRNDQGEQIEVPLPASGETITLKLLGTESAGAWACAGFIKGER